jgi:hypothetical protein
MTSIPWFLPPNAELTGRRRQGARPARRMMNQGAARAWWPAVGAPVERPVRPHGLCCCAAGGGAGGAAGAGAGAGGTG